MNGKLPDADGVPVADQPAGHPAAEEPRTEYSSLHRLMLGGREIVLVGTAHVSRQSVNEVRAVIESVRPDVVCVELDEARYRNLVDLGRWRNTNISQVIREGRAMLLLSSLVMASFQRRIGNKLGVVPGAELLEGVRAAQDAGARLVLADRDIQITLKRAWGSFGWRERFKVLYQLIGSLFALDEIDESAIEELKRQEKLSDVLSLLAEELPMLKQTLIDERDVYLAQKIREAGGQRLVAVVGAGHVQGVLRALQEEHDLQPLESVPPPSGWQGVLKWALPAMIVGLIGYGFVAGGTGRSLESLAIWCVVTGTLAALGAAAAWAHPLSILAALLAAPVTTLHPLLAAGWVSGLVQAVVKKPTVQDLESLPEAIGSVRGFWTNPVSRILLVVAFSNLGSTLGTLVAGSWLAARVFQ